MLHRNNLALWAELDIKSSFRAVHHGIPLNLGKVFHRLSAVRASGIFRILYPVGKASYRIHILAAGTVEQGYWCFPQYKGIFSEGFVKDLVDPFVQGGSQQKRHIDPPAFL